MKLAIIQSNLGGEGASRWAFEVAKEFNAKIYTTLYQKKPGFYEELQNLVVPTRITFAKFEKLRIIEMLTRSIIRQDIDADFHVYSLLPPRLEAIKGDIPFLYYAHQYTTFGVPSYKLQKLIHLYFIGSRRIIANSKHVLKRLKSLYGCRPREVLYPPVRLENFYNKPSEEFYLTVGRLERWKRIDLQILAFRKTEEKLFIVGDGPDKVRLEGLANKIGANVNFLGRVTDRELRDIYSRCKAFIFSSRDEPLGLTPVEALASGKPIICINEGGPLEYLQPGENSVIFRDVNELRMIVNTYRTELYDSMKDQCLKAAMKFDATRIFGKMRKIIHEITEERYKHV